jgi:ankyrin repeat protein
VWANDPATVRRLAEAGADLEARDEHYTWTPLYCAVYFNHFRVVEALVEKGARCDAKVTRDYREITPFQLAVHQGQFQMLELFLKRPEGKRQVNVPFRAERRTGDADRVTRHGAGALRTPLSLAMGSLPTVRLLLAHGADVRLADADGETPLDSVSSGAWQETQIGDPDPEHLGKLARAAVNEVCRELLARGADPNGRNGGPLRSAAGGNPQMVRMLIEKGARIDVRDNEGNTPLLVAMNSARLWPRDPAPAIESALALVAAGADVRAENAAGRTVLTVGLSEWRYVRELFRMRPGRERREELSKLEKHYDNSIATIRALLATGKVDIHMRNKAGETVLAYAVREKMTRVAEYLRQAGARY